MSSWVSPLVALGLVLTACGGSGTANSGSTTTSSSTTTTVATTTTTLAITTTSQTGSQEPEPGAELCQEITARAALMEPTTQYCAESFLVPLVLQVDSGRWLVRSGADSAVMITLDRDEDGSTDASLAVLAFQADQDPEASVDGILQTQEGIVADSVPASFTAGEYTGLVVTVQGDPQPLPFEPEGCTSAGSPNFSIDSPGHPVVNTGGFEPNTDYGFPACFRSRLWIIDVGDVSVTAIGVADPDDRFDEFMPILEDFLENSVTFGVTDG